MKIYNKYTIILLVIFLIIQLFILYRVIKTDKELSDLTTELSRLELIEE